jgi:hypothetical protein
MVTGPASARVTVSVLYKTGKPMVSHGKISATGTYDKTCKVPKNAPIGLARIKVMVSGTSSERKPTEVDFTVLK